jgi:hypothetical protein
MIGAMETIVWLILFGFAAAQTFDAVASIADRFKKNHTPY